MQVQVQVKSVRRKEVIGNTKEGKKEKSPKRATMRPRGFKIRGARSATSMLLSAALFCIQISLFCILEQPQKRYMVSGSPCPLISFLDVHFSASFVVRGQRPRRGR